ncbi:MAG: MBL fold metallo-hydrolase [archaeon]
MKKILYIVPVVLLVVVFLVLAAKPYCGDGTCKAPETYETCPADCTAAVCGDGVKAGSEDCDGFDFGGETCQSIGWAGGTLNCNTDCTYDTAECTGSSCVPVPGKCVCDGTCTDKEQRYVDGGGICGDCDVQPPVCGDDTAEAPEVCDGTDLLGENCITQGYDYGNLACLGDCTAFDYTDCHDYLCGNDATEGTEVCDGTDVNGFTCQSFGYDYGNLGCIGDCSGYDYSDCHYDVSNATLEVHYIDVGQGDAEFIITPDGYTMLIDAGEDNKGAGVVSYIQGLGYNKIDYIMVSHLHADHLGGMDIVVNALNPDVCYDHGGTYTTVQYNEYNAACSGKRQELNMGDNMSLGPSVYTRILQAGYSSDENTKSVVMELSYNSLDLLFGGDCSSSCEATISPGNLEVYKVHHHGSATSSTQALLDNILPEVSIIEVGPNSYGHPTQAVLDRLAGIGSDIYRTDLDGTVLLTSDGSTTYYVEGNVYTAS